MMAGVRESRLWQWLSDAPKKFWRDQLDIQRVENGVALGVPDVEGCLQGESFWIELKTSDRPKRATTRIRARFEDWQVPWLRRRCRAGGKAFLLIQVGSGRSAGRYLLPGDRASMLDCDGCTEAELLVASLVDPCATAMDVLRAAAYTYGGRSLA